VELIASILLLLTPRTVTYGAVLSLGVPSYRGSRDRPAVAADQPISISSFHPNAYPTAVFTSEERRAGNLEIRSTKVVRATVLRLSQFATQGL
jgi:hypothetical protein